MVDTHKSWLPMVRRGFRANNHKNHPNGHCAVCLLAGNQRQIPRRICVPRLGCHVPPVVFRCSVAVVFRPDPSNLAAENQYGEFTISPSKKPITYNLQPSLFVFPMPRFALLAMVTFHCQVTPAVRIKAAHPCPALRLHVKHPLLLWKKSSCLSCCFKNS